MGPCFWHVSPGFVPVVPIKVCFWHVSSDFVPIVPIRTTLVIVIPVSVPVEVR